jgi:hypothetical protein
MRTGGASVTAAARGTEERQMRSDEAQEQEAAPLEERIVDASGAERRRAFRRKLPFGSGAVLLVGERAHIVGLADLSVSGAYLTTRAQVAKGEVHKLRLMLLPDRMPFDLTAEVVRVAQQEHESANHPRGVAVCFRDLDDGVFRRLQTFIARVGQREARAARLSGTNGDAVE